MGCWKERKGGRDGGMEGGKEGGIGEGAMQHYISSG